MVSLKTFATLGVILAGVALFFGLGGASGIGQRIGGSFSAFGSSFLGGLGLQNAFGSSPDSPSDPLNPNPNLSGDPTPIGFELLNESLTKQSNILQDINNLFSNIISGAQFNPSAFNPSSSFTQVAIQQRLDRANDPSRFNQGGTQFGGFANATEQELALQNAILQSQIDNPSFFLK